MHSKVMKILEFDEEVWSLLLDFFDHLNRNVLRYEF
ncbi:MAG: hypothetical protein ACI9FN_002361 [Saprospiraceae bacterium]|jgi:hypothetical protein